MRRPSRLSLAGIAVAVSVALLSGCAQTPQQPPKPGTTPAGPAVPEAPPAKLTLKPARFADLPGWAQDRQADAIPAMAKSCDRLLRQPADRALGPDGMLGRIADWQAPCAALAKLKPGDHAAARTWVERWFQPFVAANNGDSQGLFTGYYESALRGSLKRQGPYQTPLYKRPADLVMVDLGEFRPNLKGERIAGRVQNGQLKPYDDRKAIDAGSLTGKGLELLYVDNAIDAFFLAIQGSGRVTLPDGREIRVGYDGQNGHPYVAIGRELVARGALTKDQVSMQTIRAWLDANPTQALALMQTNPSYVFFRQLEGEGPVGAQGVALTPGRSLAVDRSFVPYGMPLWLEAEDPLNSSTSIRRLMVAQDTGGAIRGPVRGDVFWGHGKDAETRAGLMKSKGRYWLLLPRSVAVPVS